MNVLLISGFLGAGKTTLVKHLLASDYKELGKVAIIVNELGTVGIDGELLSGRNVDILELTSGCICCTIRSDFLKAIQEIHERINPDYLVVEATGVAQPSDMLEPFLDPPISDFSRIRNLVTVVDAGFFEAREVLGPFYEKQIVSSDLLILNKVDEVDKETLDQIKATLQTMNMRAMVVPTKFAAVEPSVLFERSKKAKREDHPAHALHEHFHDSGFQSFTFKEKRPFDRSKLRSFLEDLPPTLFRLKGWARFPESTELLNYSWGGYRLEHAENRDETALVFIGRNCDEKALIDAVEHCVLTG
jgi:G3E family GTPase